MMLPIVESGFKAARGSEWSSRTGEKAAVRTTTHPDADAPNFVKEVQHKLLVDAFLNDYPRARDTSLSRCDERRERSATRRGYRVGVVENHDWGLCPLVRFQS
jgi:predicted metalloprotease